MTYMEWADNYYTEAQKIKSRISELRIQKETAPLSKLQELNGRIQSLYAMYLDCIHTYTELARRKGVAF